MTESESRPPNRAARRRWRRAHTVLAVVLVGAVGVGAVVYVTRRAIARELLVGWLEARGVPADVEFREFEFGGFTARVRAGAPNDPDVSVERVEVRYGLAGFWSGQPLGVQVASVRLYRPVLKGSFKNGKFSLGALDPLVEEFTRKPPQPETPQPRIDIHGGVARLDTDYGLLTARAEGRLERGKLMALEARLDPATLKGPGVQARLGETRLRLATTRDRLDVLLLAPLASVQSGQVSARNATLRLSLQGPYPDLKKKRAEGKLAAQLVIEGEQGALGADRLDGLRLAANFEGATTGWIHNLVVGGDGDLQLNARGGRAAGVALRDLKGQASLGDVRWTRRAGDVVSGEISTRLSAAEARTGDLTLTNASGDFGGLVALDGRRVDLALNGSLASRGAWSGLGAPVAGDPPQTAALKQALSGFQLTANSISLSASRGDVSVSLRVPAHLRTDSGGDLALYRASGPIYANGAGGFGLSMSGGGLPEGRLDVSRYRLTADGLVASTALKARGGFAPVSDGAIDAEGELRLAGGNVDFIASRCVALAAGHVELGENDLERLSGEVCPASGSMFSLRGETWRLHGQAKALSGALPSLEIRLSDATGPIDLSGRGAELDGAIQVARARVDDTAAETRFNPVRVAGRASAVRGAWTGAFGLADLAGRRLAEARLTQGANGRGALDVDTGVLGFEPGGLQPAELSPLAAVVASPAQGRARFVGQIAWSPNASSSHGVLSVERLDFVSPMGPVVGLAGQAAFDSLIPLTAAPGQSLTAQAVNTLVPLTEVEVKFGLQPDAVSVGGAQFAMGGGTVAFEPFTVPFKPGAPWKGVMVFDGVQVKDLVKASPFGDRVDLEARLSGRVPFEVTPEGVRVAGGSLRAIEPGKLSIRRETFATNAVEGGGVTAPIPTPVEPTPEATNAMAEFAYQAMEYLAFDTLDAEVNSLPSGRLGVLMHLKGEHAPPQKQEIRLSIMDLIRRDFLDRELPLPSGTRVDLTLDTSLNLDQILKDFADYQALRGSQAVQP